MRNKSRRNSEAGWRSTIERSRAGKNPEPLPSSRFQVRSSTPEQIPGQCDTGILPVKFFRREAPNPEFEAGDRLELHSKMRVLCAGVAELADAPDSKSGGWQHPWGFNSPLRHHRISTLSKSPSLYLIPLRIREALWQRKQLMLDTTPSFSAEKGRESKTEKGKCCVPKTYLCPFEGG